MILLEKVEKQYGSRVVFRGLDLAVKQGEIVALMGSSGSGKSTILNLIGGMDIPDGGRVLVESEDISHYNEEQLTAYRRKKIGFIFQFFNLLPNISIYENIEIPLLLNSEERYDERIRYYLRMAGLEGREQDRPSSLSGGEQQRVAIVRSLVHDPRIILADEPTGNLDSKNGDMVMQLITETARRTGKTVLLATHNQATAEYADRIVRIKDGVLT